MHLSIILVTSLTVWSVNAQLLPALLLAIAWLNAIPTTDELSTASTQGSTSGTIAAEPCGAGLYESQPGGGVH